MGTGIALPNLRPRHWRWGWEVSTTPRPLYPRERPGTHCTGGWVGPRAGLDGCGKSRPPPGFDPRTVKLAASRYTDWAIAGADYFDYLYQILPFSFLHKLTNLLCRCSPIVRWEFLLLILGELICTLTLTTAFVTCPVPRHSCDIYVRNSKPSVYHETSLWNLKCKLLRKLQNEASEILERNIFFFCMCPKVGCQ